MNAFSINEFFKIADNEVIQRPLNEELLRVFYEAYKNKEFLTLRDLSIKGPIHKEDMSLIGVRIHTRFEDCYTYTHYVHVPSMQDTWKLILHLLRVPNNTMLIKRGKMICS